MKKWLPIAGGVIGIAILLLAVGFLIFRAVWQTLSPGEESIPPELAQDRQLYFYDVKTQKFSEQVIQVHKNTPIESQIKLMIKKMAARPNKAGIKTFWPLRLEVRSVYLRKNGLLILDFEKGVQYNQNHDAWDEWTAVRSIILTMILNFEGIRQIKLLVGGQENDTLAGHINISRPFKIEDAKRE